MISSVSTFLQIGFRPVITKFTLSWLQTQLHHVGADKTSKFILYLCYDVKCVFFFYTEPAGGSVEVRWGEVAE